MNLPRRCTSRTASAQPQRAGRDQRAVLAERVPGHGDRPHGRPRSRSTRSAAIAGRQDRRLRVRGQRQLVLGPSKQSFDSGSRARRRPRRTRRAPRDTRRAARGPCRPSASPGPGTRTRSWMRRCHRHHHLTAADAQASPPPSAVNSRMSPSLELLLLDRLVERGRHRRRRRVAVAIDVEEEPLHRNADPLRDALEDAQVGLMARPPRSTSSGVRPLASRAVLRAGGHVANGVLVDLAPVHLHEVPLGGDALGRSAARGCRPRACSSTSVSEPSA